jgi:hypothetical protein
MKILRIALSGIGLILLATTIALSLSTGTEVGGKKPIIFDKKIIAVFQNISTIVPSNESIVSPSFTPIVKYFAGREVSTPYSVTSYKSLLNVMSSKNYTYLLVFEGKSDIAALMQIFRKEQLPYLAKDFKEIAAFNTDFSKLHLYKRI